MMRLPWLICCLSCWLCASCLHSARITSPVDDYAQYRRVRTAPHFEARLRESWNYLRAYPAGQFQAEVRRWFVQAEERTRVQAWNDLARLHRYLNVLAEGPYADRVRARIVALEAERRSAAAEEATLMRQAREREARFQQAEASRVHFRKQLVNWVGRLSQFQHYGQVFAGSELEREFAPADAAWECSPNACQVTLGGSFDIPVAGQLQERAVHSVLVVHLHQGAVVGLTLQAFALFDRIAESLTLRAVRSGDAQARAEAIGSAVAVLAVALEPGLPEKECAAEAISPTLIARTCAGRFAKVQLAEDYTQPDAVVFGAVPAQR